MKSILDFFDQFIRLSPVARKLIVSTSDEIQLPKGEVLSMEGESNLHFYIIKSGLVRGFYETPKKQITCCLRKENEGFGDMITYITGPAMQITYELLEDSTLFRVRVMEFRALYSVNHEICNLSRIISESFILHLLKGRRRYRELTAQQKYDYFLTDLPGLIYRVKFIYIASFLNLSHETLSRIHKKHFKNIG